MSGIPTPKPRALSPWWVLLVVPAGLLVGWLVAQLPGSKPQELKAAARPEATTVPAGVEPPVAKAVPADRSATEAHGDASPSWSTGEGSEPAAAEIKQPAEEARRNEVSAWTTLENAFEESRRNGKPILIDFNADWCGPCQAMKRLVFEDGSLGQAVQTAVIPVSIVDRTREEGSNRPEIEDLQRRFQVTAFPTLVVFSPQTGRALRTQGFGGAEGTLAWITEAAKAVR